VRLTLRTLLSYLDDTLEPAQAKLIGEKVAESDQARELMEHIKRVTRRRHITATPANGPAGKIDPNTIAEYLDGAVSAEQAAEVEQVCLDSDPHLAEIAACHQILALVLGEPALVPPTAKARMYGLVKGPESIPFRRPTNPLPSREDDSGFTDSYVGNDTQPAGLPIARGLGQWTNIILLIVSGMAASVLLFWAIWEVLNQDRGSQPRTAQLLDKSGDDKEKDGSKGKGQGPNGKSQDDGKKVVPKTDKPKEVKPKDDGKGKDNGKVKGKESDHKDDGFPNIKPPDFNTPTTTPKDKAEGDLMPELRFVEADNRPQKLGVYQTPTAKEPSIVAWRPIANADKAWVRLFGDKIVIESGNTYAALPGFRGDLILMRGQKAEPSVQLTLAGNLPTIIPELPLLESVVDMHHHDSHIDLTLKRGRIVLTSLKDANVAVRVRLENPHAPQADFADIMLHGKGTQVFIDRIGSLKPGAHFVRDPKSPERVLPDFFLGIWVAAGQATVRFQSVGHDMSAPPGNAFLNWSTMKDEKGENLQVTVSKTDSLPVFVALTPPLPHEKIDKKFIDEFNRAREDLSKFIGGAKGIDNGLAENLKQKDAARQILVIRAYAGLGFLDELIDILRDDAFNGGPQFIAMEGLKNWIISGRDHEYALYARLLQKFPLAETPLSKTADKIMELLHGAVTDRDVLVDYLGNDNPIIRQLAHTNLENYLGSVRQFMAQALSEKVKPEDRQMAQKILASLGIFATPTSLKAAEQVIQYNPAMPPEARAAAQESYRRLLKTLAGAGKK
jgi:hypothetical protein